MNNNPVLYNRFEEIINPISEEIESFEKVFHNQFQSDFFFSQPCQIHQLIAKDSIRLYPSLFFLSQGLIRRPRPESSRIAVLIEYIHLAIVIHDKVFDVSSFQDSTQTQNGNVLNQSSVLIGDYLLANVLKLGVESRWNGLLEILSRTVMAIAEEKLFDVLDGAESGRRVEDYLGNARNETAILFGASCELGGLVANATSSMKHRLRRFGETIGMIYLTRLMKMKNNLKEKNILLQELANKKEKIQNGQDIIKLWEENALAILGTFSPTRYRESFESLIYLNSEATSDKFIREY